jgi:hypothetical protein
MPLERGSLHAKISRSKCIEFHRGEIPISNPNVASIFAGYVIIHERAVDMRASFDRFEIFRVKRRRYSCASANFGWVNIISSREFATQSECAINVSVFP